MTVRVTNPTRYTLHDRHNRSWAPGESDVVDAEAETFGPAFHVEPADYDGSNDDIVNHYIEQLNQADSDNALLSQERESLAVQVLELQSQNEALTAAAASTPDSTDSVPTEAEASAGDVSEESADEAATADTDEIGTDVPDANAALTTAVDEDGLQSDTDDVSEVRTPESNDNEDGNDNG